MINRKFLFIVLIVLSILMIGCSKQVYIDKNNKSLVKYDFEISNQDKIDNVLSNQKYIYSTNVIYYVLNDEYLDNNDKAVSKLVMQFMCYDGVKDNIYPYTNVVAMDKVNTIEESRQKLFKDSPDELRLPDNTIVSQNVLTKWKIENYDGVYSYTDKSPKDLSYLSFR